RHRYPPPLLGSSSGARAHLPEHLLCTHGRIETELCRARIKASAAEPSLCVVVLVETLDSSLLDSLQSLAEQSLERFAVRILSRQDGPRADWLARPGITTTLIRTDSLLPALADVAREANDDWLVLLHAGDRLMPHALLAVAADVCERTEAQ